MPTLTYYDINKIFDLYPEYKNVDTFIETGTYMGDTTKTMSEYFKQVYTIEIKKELHEFSKNKLKDIPNITCLHGDTSILLEQLLNNINIRTNCMFFLDAHYSSGETGKGKLDVPLLEELDIINKTYKKNGIIIVDDYNLFGTKGNEDWSNITIDKIFPIFNDRLQNFYIENQRLILII